MKPVVDPLGAHSGSRPSSADILSHVSALEIELSKRQRWLDGFRRVTDEITQVQSLLPTVGRNDSMVDEMTSKLAIWGRIHRGIAADQDSVNRALAGLAREGRDVASRIATIERQVYDLTDSFNTHRLEYEQKALLDGVPMLSDVEEAFRKDINLLHSRVLDDQMRIDIKVNQHHEECEHWWARCRAVAQLLTPNFDDPAPAHDEAGGSAWAKGTKLPIQQLGGQLWTGVNAIDIGDVRQGNLGDCWFAAAIASLVQTPKGRQMIHDMIFDNGDGTFTVTFPSGQSVLVDGDVYVGSNGKPLAAQLSPDGDYWFLILEKAYAAAIKRGDRPTWSYDSMRGGSTSEVFETLGIGSATIEIPGASSGEVEAMLRNSNHGVPTTVGLFEPLFSGHALTVVRVEDGPPPLVVLRNPWGQNDNVPLEKCGACALSDGEFSIPLDRFMESVRSISSVTWPT